MFPCCWWKRRAKLSGRVTVVGTGQHAYRCSVADENQSMAGGALRLSLLWRMPLPEKLLAGFALLLIGVGTATVTLLPMGLWRRVLGRSVGAIACTPLLSDRQLGRARQLRAAIARAASVAPYRSDCLPQAFAGAVLCKLFGVPSAVHFGTKPGESSTLVAHAWLAAGPLAVTGGHSWNQFAVVACFVRP
jgi:Transglutaminase-like superfamily